MSDVEVHRRKRNRALMERAQAIEDIIARCKAMTLEQFAKLPRTLFLRLTADQRASVIASFAPAAGPEVKAGTKDKPPQTIRQKRRQEKPNWLRIAIAGLVWGTAASLIVIAVLSAVPLIRSGTPIVRPAQSALWPKCPRLTPQTDGCVYIVSSGLTWNAAAELLKLQEAYLRIVNRASEGTSLSPGQSIVVWRGHGHLTQ